MREKGNSNEAGVLVACGNENTMLDAFIIYNQKGKSHVTLSTNEERC